MSTRLSGVLAVYGAALLQGMTLVSFPASSAVLRSMHGFSDAQYGAIFLPQVGLAVVGSVLGGALAARVGLRALLIAAMLANALSQLALAATLQLSHEAAYLAVLAGTGTMGFGFGLLGAPMNSYPPLFFPRRRETAVVAVHTLVGVGLTVGPALFGVLQMGGDWGAFPLSLMAMALLLAGVAAAVALPSSERTSQAVAHEAASRPATSPVFWMFFAIGVIYAFAEGTFSNWIVVYLQDGKHLGPAIAALALSVFWGALVAGRLLISVLVLHVPARRIWIALPALMGAIFLALPSATTPVLGIGLFALAGLACSAFFPLSIALVSERFPRDVSWVSSMMIAALMIGVGLGSFAIGALRNQLAFEQLYQLSVIYPALVLMLAFLTTRQGRSRTHVAMDM
jgi:predicted MFS family arabinose efflux permease